MAELGFRSSTHKTSWAATRVLGRRQIVLGDYKNARARCFHTFLTIRAQRRLPARIIRLGVGRSVIYRFDEFALDAGRKRLSHKGIDIILPDACIAILEVLLSRPGQIVSKDDLADAAWGRGAEISQNSVDRAISTLRARIGDTRIATIPRQGHRFCGDIVPEASTEPVDPIESLVPDRSLIEANALIDTLDCRALARAVEMSRTVVAAQPTNAAAFTALATAEALLYESTRMDIAPDREMLGNAVRDARHGQRLEPTNAETWSTLAFVLSLVGAAADSVAAANRAIGIDARNWRNHFRLSYVSWGEARRQAAYQVMQLSPGLAFAHWLVATVFIARGAFKEAIAELRIGAALQDAQNLERGRFNAVGLHLLLGLVLAASGLLQEAIEEFHRELSAEVPGQIYARECAANTWYSMGAVLLRAGRVDEAIDACGRALERIPGHALATIALAMATGNPIHAPATAAGVIDADAVLATTVALAGQGQPAAGARFITETLAQAAPAGTAWLLPVEPLINAAARPDCWSDALRTIAVRAW